MAQALLTSDPSIAALISAVITAVGLLTRFSQRRLMGSAFTVSLFLFIVVLTGTLADLVAHIPTSGKVGLLGAGTTLPFWTQKPGTGGDLKTNSSAGRTLASALLSLLWTITGFLTDILDTRLSTSKGLAVESLKFKLLDRYENSLSLADRLQALLKQHADDLTSTPARKQKNARLRLAYDESNKKNGDIAPLVSLAYDWKLDNVLLQIVVTGR